MKLLVGLVMNRRPFDEQFLPGCCLAVHNPPPCRGCTRTHPTQAAGMRDIDIESLFGSTSGICTPAMAQEAGISRSELRYRLDRGVWRRISGDGIGLATRPDSAWRLATAACLTWPDAIVCLTTAAELHGLPVTNDGSAHVAVPDTRRPRVRLRPHYFRHGSPVCHRGPVTLTSLPVTIADCLTKLPDEEAWSLLAWVRTREIIAVDKLVELALHRFAMHGVQRLRELVAAAQGGALSVGERDLHALLHEGGVQGWVPDSRVWHNGTIIARVDVLFPDERVVVEFDGELAHGPRQRERDLQRQNRLVAAGYTVLRFTWADLRIHPGRVLSTIRASLEIARRSGQTA